MQPTPTAEQIPPNPVGSWHNDRRDKEWQYNYNYIYIQEKPTLKLSHFSGSHSQFNCGVSHTSGKEEKKRLIKSEFPLQNAVTPKEPRAVAVIIKLDLNFLDWGEAKTQDWGRSRTLPKKINLFLKLMWPWSCTSAYPNTFSPSSNQLVPKTKSQTWNAKNLLSTVKVFKLH